MTTPFWSNDTSSGVPFFDTQPAETWATGDLDRQQALSAPLWSYAQAQSQPHHNQLPDFLLPPTLQPAATRRPVNEIQEIPCDSTPVASTSRLPSEAPSQGDVSVKRKRTKLGCVFCKRSKKGCTLERPSCKRCVALNYECSYPEASAPSKIGPRVAAKKKTSQSKTSQLVEYSSWSPDDSLFQPTSPRTQSLEGWPTMYPPISTTDPIFDAFSSASQYSTPSVSYSAFQQMVSPRDALPSSNTAFVDLIRDALVDPMQADRLAGIYVMSHWIAAHVSPVAHKQHDLELIEDFCSFSQRPSSTSSLRCI